MTPIPSYADTDADGRPMWWGGDEGAFELRNLVTTLLSHEMFDTLDRLLDDWTRNAERTADGKWKLVSFLDQLDNRFEWQNGWEREYALIQRWKARNPRSIGAAVAEAFYWRSYAWNARGTRFANEVDDDAWKPFYERSKKGEDVLLASKSYAGDHPLWAQVYMCLMAGLSWPLDEQFALYRKLLAKHKYLYDLNFSMVNLASPKWGGSWRLVEQVARDAEAATKDVDGATLYARVYWSAAGSNRGNDIFRESEVDWSHMKQGFEDMMARYPHSYRNMNAYAYFACGAGDGEAFRAARYRMGNSVEMSVWAGRSLDLCEHKFPLKKAERRIPTNIKAAFR